MFTLNGDEGADYIVKYSITIPCCRPITYKRTIKAVSKVSAINALRDSDEMFNAVNCRVIIHSVKLKG